MNKHQVSCNTECGIKQSNCTR